VGIVLVTAHADWVNIITSGVGFIFLLPIFSGITPKTEMGSFVQTEKYVESKKSRDIVSLRTLILLHYMFFVG
jgi:hypothetical protein